MRFQRVEGSLRVWEVFKRILRGSGECKGSGEVTGVSGNFDVSGVPAST